MNANFTGRAGRIVAWLAQHPAGLSTSEVHQFEKELHPAVTATQVSASLLQLFTAKKIDRIGRALHYTYLPKSTPAAKKKQYTSPLARAPKKESQPVVVGRKVSPRLKPRIAAPGAKPETVEEFVARGGRIQYCKPGECGYTPKSYSDLSKEHKERMRVDAIDKHKDRARNRPSPDDDAELDVAA